jgi:hypothetical protein
LMAEETEEEKLRRRFANLPSSGRIGPTKSERTIEQIGLDIQKLLEQHALNPEAPTTAAELFEIQRLGRQLEQLYQGQATRHDEESDEKRLSALVHGWDRVAYGMLRDFRTGAYSKALDGVRRLLDIDRQIEEIIQNHL